MIETPSIIIVRGFAKLALRLDHSALMIQTWTCEAQAAEWLRTTRKTAIINSSGDLVTRMEPSSHGRHPSGRDSREARRY